MSRNPLPPELLQRFVLQEVCKISKADSLSATDNADALVLWDALQERGFRRLPLFSEYQKQYGWALDGQWAERVQRYLIADVLLLLGPKYRDSGRWDSLWGLVYKFCFDDSMSGYGFDAIEQDLWGWISRTSVNAPIDVGTPIAYMALSPTASVFHGLEVLRFVHAEVYPPEYWWLLTCIARWLPDTPRDYSKLGPEFPARTVETP